MIMITIKTTYFVKVVLFTLLIIDSAYVNGQNVVNKSSLSNTAAAAAKKINKPPTQTAEQRQQQQQKLEKERLIEIFKEKLLEILNIKELPFNNTVESNKKAASENIPEPVLAEYWRVVNETEKRKKQHYNNIANGLYLNDEARAELEVQIKKNEEKDEELRFSSFVEEITLLPKLNLDACNKNSTQTKLNYEFELISCFEFELENKEFFEFEIDNARLYLELTRKQISNLNFLFVEINDELVKKIDFSNRKNEVENSNEDDDEYEHVDLKDLITNFLLQSEIENMHKFLRPKLSIKLLNLKSNKNLLNQNLFKNIHEQVALIVKFGERTIREFKYQTICEKTPNLKYCQMHSNEIKNKTINLIKTRARRTPNPVDKYFPEKSVKTFYECDEIKQSLHQIPPNKCCRAKITISMEEIGWSNWIARPSSIEFKYCRGGCTGMLTSKYYHTNLVKSSLQKISHPYLEQTQCCNVYDYDEPIQLLYHQDGGYKIGEFQISAKNCMCS